MQRRTWLLWVVGAGLCACGGSGGGGGGGVTPLNLVNFQFAGDILGQSAVNGATANNGAGAASPNQAGLDAPRGHVGSGSLYVADTQNHRVLGWIGSPTGLAEPADFVIGQANFASQVLGNTATGLDTPKSCWVAGGQLFVVDQLNSRVLIYGGPPISNVAATVALGQPTLTGGGQAAGPAGLNFPEDVCVAANRVVVVDAGNHRVMVWNGVPGASGANAQVVLGQPNFTTVSAGTTATKMFNPSSVWTDGTRLAVTDLVNNRVLIWTTFPTSNGQPADVVVGQSDFTSNSSGASAQKFFQPWGVASDGAQLYVSDFGNNRVLIFSPFPTTSNPVATGVLGQSSFTNVAANDDDQNGLPDASPTARTMNEPLGVTVVGNRLYVMDAGNNRILVFTSS